MSAEALGHAAVDCFASDLAPTVESAVDHNAKNSFELPLRGLALKNTDGSGNGLRLAVRAKCNIAIPSPSVDLFKEVHDRHDGDAILSSLDCFARRGRGV